MDGVRVLVRVPLSFASGCWVQIASRSMLVLTVEDRKPGALEDREKFFRTPKMFRKVHGGQSGPDVESVDA